MFLKFDSKNLTPSECVELGRNLTSDEIQEIVHSYYLKRLEVATNDDIRRISRIMDDVLELLEQKV